MMARSALVTAGLIATVFAHSAPAAAPIPADKRIPVRVVRTLAAPPDQPMHMPTDVAVDSEGRVFVADGVNDRIVCFARDGQFNGAITAPDGLTLSRPLGVSVDATGQVWIANSGKHEVIVLRPDGKLAEHIKLPAAEQPFDPTDVAVTADGKRAYIVDNDSHRLAVRDNATGAMIFLGKYGEGLGQFRWPFMICIGTEGYVYVSEAIGARLQRITPTDRWAGQVGRWGVELGQLYRPTGVAADTAGRLYIADSTLDVVQVFSARGALEGVLCGSSEAPVPRESEPRAGEAFRLRHPMGLCFDAQGRLYVTELLADRIVVVDLPWTGPAPPTTGPAGSEGGGR